MRLNRQRIEFQVGRFGKAILTGLVFVAVLFCCSALFDWADSMQPFWIRAMISGAAGVLAVAGLAFYFRRAPKAF